MELTKEQSDIIASAGNIKINAVAGSGKTTTIIEYARTRPGLCKILYLAFNKSVKFEAAGRFAALKLNNVKVETAHSLAYRHVVLQSRYKVRAQGYKTNEIAELLGLKGNGEKHAEYVIANHINKFVAYFCNSDKRMVRELNYLDTITDPKAQIFVESFYDYIETQSRLLLSKMDKGEIEITHDFYLKKFQLSNPVLHYDYILFDEGQDASAAMLDIFFKQKATKIIVGDTHQQIYSWRYAVNSLEKAAFKTYQLSTSFRFSQDIANLAMHILELKSSLGEYQAVPITGKGSRGEIKTSATLARTNLGLLLRAIEYVTGKREIGNIYFEGNINSYTYADEGTSLYDVLNLYNHKYYLIKDKLIRAMKSIEELEEYIEKTEDAQLAVMVEIVKEYGNEIPDIIKAIKKKHIQNNDKEKAEMIFSTVHRCKGMEYDCVQLADDFITEEKIKQMVEKDNSGSFNAAKLNEEVNLLYVAVTRAKNCIYIPETLIPKGFPGSPQIHLLNVVGEEVKVQGRKTAATGSSEIKGVNNEKSYTVGQFRDRHKAANSPWTPELDDELTIMFCEGVSIKEMAKHFGRTRGAIALRIRKLELEDLYG